MESSIQDVEVDGKRCCRRSSHSDADDDKRKLSPPELFCLGAYPALLLLPGNIFRTCRMLSATFLAMRTECDIYIYIENY